jgi:hypothetical protein
VSSVLSVSVEAVCRGVGVVCHGLLKIHEEKEKKNHSANPKQIKGRKLYKKNQLSTNKNLEGKLQNF